MVSASAETPHRPTIMRRNTEQARTGRILAAGVVAETVTKVTASLRALVAVTACVLLVCVMLAAEDHAAQAAATPQVSAKALYEQLASVGLYPGRVYQVRDGALDREDLHISLDDGTIAFTRDVLGRITGAMFEG